MISFITASLNSYLRTNNHSYTQGLPYTPPKASLKGLLAGLQPNTGLNLLTSVTTKLSP